MGGTLIVTKKTTRHQDFKKRFESLGFKDVFVTNEDRDALYFRIDKLKPEFIFIDAMFNCTATPYMIKMMFKNKYFKFKNLNIAVFSVDEYPVKLGAKFIANGVKSYIDINDGETQFDEGLLFLRKGKEYISPTVQEWRLASKNLPEPSRIITERHIEVLKLFCGGFARKQIAKCLYISARTVDSHKRVIYQSLGSKIPFELLNIADEAGLFTLKDLIFFCNQFDLRSEEKKVKTNKKV
jgi:DNA-binding NarL/FixJ family response regulator